MGWICLCGWINRQMALFQVELKHSSPCYNIFVLFSLCLFHLCYWEIFAQILDFFSNILLWRDSNWPWPEDLHLLRLDDLLLLWLIDDFGLFSRDNFMLQTLSLLSPVLSSLGSGIYSSSLSPWVIWFYKTPQNLSKKKKKRLTGLVLPKWRSSIIYVH